jgi:hypothetical protein
MMDKDRIQGSAEQARGKAGTLTLTGNNARNSISDAAVISATFQLNPVPFGRRIDATATAGTASRE